MYITPKQLKLTNLIFAEHWKLLQENKLLFKQIENYKNDNNLLLESDSLRTLQLRNYERLTQAYTAQLENLSDDLAKKNRSLKTWKIGGISVTVGLALWLLLK